MAEQSKPISNTEITLTVGPGYPGESDRILRISPDQARFLRECLEAEGLHVSTVLEFSAGSWLEVLAVVVGSGGTAAALVKALQIFLERNKDKNVSFGVDGKVESMAGYSAKDVQRVLATVEQIQREYDKKWAAKLDEDKATTTPTDEADPV